MSYSSLGLPSQYVTKSFEALAHFHATTYHYIQTQPDRVEEYYGDTDKPIGGFFSILRRSKLFEGKHLDNVNLASKSLSNNSISPRLAQKIKGFLKDNLLECLKDNEEPKGNFYVILHGDAWANNFMYRYMLL